MEFLKIVLLSIGMAILYGLIHDQFTVRICVEYFTIGHPPIFSTTDPTLLALGWGVIATWWAGGIIGLFVACAARIGSWPKQSMRSLIRPILLLLCAMGAGAVIAGVIGYLGAKNGSVSLPDMWNSRIPADKQVAFITDLWIHNGSYLVGFFGGMFLAVRVAFQRKSAMSYQASAGANPQSQFTSE